MEVRLEIGDQGVLLEHREAFGVGDRVGRNVQILPFSQPRKSDEITTLLRLLPFRVEPDADFRSSGNLLPYRVQMLIPRNLFPGEEQLPCSFAEQVVTLADGPLHELWPSNRQIVESRTAAT